MSALFSWLSSHRRPPRRQSTTESLSLEDGYSDVVLAPSGSPAAYPPNSTASLPQTSNAASPADSFSRIRAFLDPLWPDILDTLSYPATPESITSLVSSIRPYKLPRDVLDSLLVHDGQERESLSSLAPLEEWGLFYGLWLLSAEDIATEYDNWRKLRDGLAVVQDPFANLPPLPPPFGGAINYASPTIPPPFSSGTCPNGWLIDTYSHPSWLPLITDGIGNYIGLDLDPPRQNPSVPSTSDPISKECFLSPYPGQVIAFGRDIDVKTVLWPGGGPNSWARFLDQFADDLESGLIASIGNSNSENSKSSQPRADATENPRKYDSEDAYSDSGTDGSFYEYDGLGDVGYFDQGEDRLWDSRPGSRNRHAGWKINAKLLSKLSKFTNKSRDLNGFRHQQSNSIIVLLALLSQERWTAVGLYSPDISQPPSASSVTDDLPTPSSSRNRQLPRLSIHESPSSVEHPLDGVNVESDSSKPLALTISPPSPSLPATRFTTDSVQSPQRSPVDPSSSLPPPSRSVRANSSKQPEPLPRPRSQLPPPAPLSLPTLDELIQDELADTPYEPPAPIERRAVHRSLSGSSNPPELLPLSNASVASVASTKLSSSRTRLEDLEDGDIGATNELKNGIQLVIDKRDSRHSVTSENGLHSQRSSISTPLFEQRTSSPITQQS